MPTVRISLQEVSAMNPYIKLEISQMMLVAKNFCVSCRSAALKDDGTVDEKEKKVLDKISKATEKYIKTLEKLR